MIDLHVNIRRKLFPGCTVPALSDLEFHAHAGAFISIVGPSGAGKTTLLNIIGNLDRDFTGAVQINGIALGDYPEPLHYGYMFQEPRLLPWLNVIDNIMLVLNKQPDAKMIARTLLKNVDLEAYETAWPLQLSGGMQRRVALARAFAVNPSLLLMDEPFLSLDLPTANRLRGRLLQLWQETKPMVIFVTHDLREALALSDRIIFLSGSPGRVVLETDIPLQRPCDLNSTVITQLHNRLLADHPELLAGISATPVEHEDPAPDPQRRIV